MKKSLTGLNFSMEIRNIAIIAHVDHGKTTLTDALMRQAGVSGEEVTMDSNDLEKERGITIYSKNTSIFYKDTKINIVDTPGHADFSSEVERVLRSIDCVLLLVDAQEGPMPQTKFVLKKSLELGLNPIVVINKIDKPAANPEETEEMVYELFLDLGANDQQLSFTTVYAISKQGIAKRNLTDQSENLNPLLDVILEKVPATSSDDLREKPLAAQVFNLAYDNFLGRCAVCRIYQGKIKTGQVVLAKTEKEGKKSQGKITKLFTFQGLKRQEIAEAVAGDIVMLAGLPEIFIGETIVDDERQPALPAISIDEPTIALNFLVNDSPFSGREGKFVTGGQLKERLEKELEINVGLRIDFSDNKFYRVQGRGELHIAILLENLRREGYELQVSQPKVIFKEENGQKTEPFEEITIEVPENMAGVIIEKMSSRKGQITNMRNQNGQARIVFEIPTRGFLGYRNEFVVDTKGEGILCSHFAGFRPYVVPIEGSRTGAMVSMISGKASAYALWNLQERGALYIDPAIDIYEGMIIGGTARGDDMAVNPVKGKHLTNIRASGSDDAIKLTPPVRLTLEKALSIMNDDEYLEVAPQSIRLRKIHLSEADRIKSKRKKAD